MYHKAYWTGLRLNGSWPSFRWRDPYVTRTYDQWSQQPPAPSTNLAEVAAAYAPGYGKPIAYGWVDEVANATKHVAYCRVVREWPALVTCLMPAAEPGWVPCLMPAAEPGWVPCLMPAAEPGWVP